MGTIQLDPVVFGDDDFRRQEEDRRRREQDARDADARAAAQDALRSMQEMPAAPVTPPSRPGESAEAIAQASGQRPDGGRDTDYGAIVYPAGGLPLPPRAREVERRLQAGDRYGVESDVRRDARGYDDVDEEDAPRARPQAPAAAPARRSPLGNGVAAGIPPIGGATPGRPLSPIVAQDRGPLVEPGNQDADYGARAMAGRKPRELPLPPPDQRLDAGLPSESDIGSARAGDAVRRIFHALGAGLVRSSGGTPTAFRSDADALQQRRDRGMRERMSAKAEARGEERQDARARERTAAQERTASIAADAQSRRAASQERLAQAQEALAAARTDRERITARRGIEEADPSSSASARARARYVLEELPRRQRLEGGDREGLRAQIESDVDGLSAADITAMEGELAGMSIGTRGSRGAGGGRSGGNADILAEAEHAGIPRAVASTMTARDLARAIDIRTRRTGAPEGEEILPGVRAGMGLATGEGRTIRQGFAEMRSQMGALQEVDSIAGQYGPGAVISPQAAGEMTAPLTRLRAMVARLQNTGVINPSEAPAIEAMLPNPTDLRQMTFGTLRARLQSFQRELDRAARSQLETRGVDAEGLDRASGLLRGDSGSREASASGPRVSVTGPNGVTRSMSAEEAQRFRGQPGFTVGGE